MAKIGDLIEIKKMIGDSYYQGKKGVITMIDDSGQLFGTWGDVAIIPHVDEIQVLNFLEENENTATHKSSH